MQDYIDKKQVEIVSHEAHNKECLFYLPHHAVKKIANEETKCRIAFDASSHSPRHPSLNDALEIGPNLLPDIMATLLRFRLSKIAITCDGSQAFLQLILSDEDRDATRFLWYKTTYTPVGKLCIEDEIVLEVKLDTDRDVFGIDVQEKIVRAFKEPVTKRLLLKLISKFYDTLDLFAPVTVIVKILFQDTWLSGIKWDELLPPAVAQQWHRWLNELQCLNDIHIPRWIGPSYAVTIHVF
ncbi:hypothetical protein HNY73_011410 [Argiope bruennichi]|uniref:Uncharacterized protein n=1 Tax=Argiope bruennichi TaxID=94029 RepID=A0A8T0F690_ARGBR|nr:hypothetical protein HNY73_011410 [Argiope bruennichi]